MKNCFYFTFFFLQAKATVDAPHLLGYRCNQSSRVCRWPATKHQPNIVGSQPEAQIHPIRQAQTTMWNRIFMHSTTANATPMELSFYGKFLASSKLISYPKSLIPQAVNKDWSYWELLYMNYVHWAILIYTQTHQSIWNFRIEKCNHLGDLAQVRFQFNFCSRLDNSFEQPELEETYIFYCCPSPDILHLHKIEFVQTELTISEFAQCIW